MFLNFAKSWVLSLVFLVFPLVFVSDSFQESINYDRCVLIFDSERKGLTWNFVVYTLGVSFIAPVAALCVIYAGIYVKTREVFVVLSLRDFKMCRKNLL